MARFDEARFALEAATGGKNTILLDDTGMPSVMVRIPAFRWCDVVDGGSEEICSAFIVDGKVYDSIYISKFLNIIENDRAYSLPGRDPAATLTIDEARAACARKGPGWHLLTNAEWCAVCHWAHKNGTTPHGNLNAGNAAPYSHEAGVRPFGVPVKGDCFGWQGLHSDEGDYPGNAPVGRTLSGLSPASWSHDGTDSGIFDLAGNVWDWIAGLRLVDSEIQIIPDNNSALNPDESENSPYWRAILPDGTLTAPGTPGTLKYNSRPFTMGSDGKLIPGSVAIDTQASLPDEAEIASNPGAGFGVMPFEAVGTAEGITAPAILKELGLFPSREKYDSEMLFLTSWGERITARGSSWYDGERGGVWTLYFKDDRSYYYPDIGFRSAYVDLK